jgi:hypothetical protein
MKILAVVAAMVFLIAVGAMAETTNDLSDAEIQGRNLARQLLGQKPAESFTNSGVLKIRDGSGRQTNFPVSCETYATVTNWISVYKAKAPEGELMLMIFHHLDGRPDECVYLEADDESHNGLKLKEELGNNFSNDFAHSDFWVGDLDLEFFHWPEQKIIKKEVRRSRGCAVLESTDPNPSTNGYSRVVSWIDEESGGIVEARAYDAQGKLLKEFYPKDFKKVDGQWQIGMMEMDNVQTGSRSRIEFDLKPE